MDAKAFLTVDEQSISLRECLKYLQTAGKLQGFLGDILRQYVLEQEIANREDLDINSAVIEQAVIDFRLQQQLTDPKVFQEWLNRNGSDYSTFHSQINSNFKVEKLKSVIADAKLQEYFIERKVFLDRVVLSRIIVENQELADELKIQIQEGTSFEELAQEHSIADDRISNGMMGPVSRGTMPDQIRAAIDSAEPGDLVGPIEVEQRWALFRVEQVIPATLDNQQLRQTLQTELFERWLAEKIQKMTVKLQVE
ncbi:peptidylprolyl isomerase [Phormidesmis priestleyi ULC007]|uniref:peptidylprolyl isomerase n=1 Tax=Phormidesmis priestleyi ULC007 TaxID=1920490 RepID=A0A2T1DME3_9CYAN|nr:peptidylprolyl isomerase [Phormidesmis priestleyi]PSB21584.1 peptidylprolyl isomerase [Phormidesmis priestleyi ULC007]PZO54625.1 MAG: peptidylprolyl isomerase [Phormidesmis priestleyi]